LPSQSPNFFTWLPFSLYLLYFNPQGNYSLGTPHSRPTLNLEKHDLKPLDINNFVSVSLEWRLQLNLSLQAAVKELDQCAIGWIYLRAEGRSEDVVRGLRSSRDCGLELLGVIEGTEGRRQMHSNLQVFNEPVGDNVEEELIFAAEVVYA
jgi:hypothetical protein